jgi:hypothetical protein
MKSSAKEALNQVLHVDDDKSFLESVKMSKPDGFFN